MTLTVNPAIDRNITADRLFFEDRAYILASGDTAGGRGINAARVIHSFGGKVRAILPVGGASGKALEEALKAEALPFDAVPIRSEIRTNFTISDKHGLTIKLNEFGPKLDESEVAALELAVRERLPKATWLMLCGSIPPGVPSDIYKRLITQANELGVKTLLDSDDQALVDGLEGGPTVVTPNQQEAERLLNKALITRSHFLEAAERIRKMGAETVLLSMGSRGVVCAQEGGLLEARPPVINAVCPIGAGDAMAAAFVWALTRNKKVAEAVRWGVAAGTASARLPGVSFATLEQTKQVYKAVEVQTAKI